MRSVMDRADAPPSSAVERRRAPSSQCLQQEGVLGAAGAAAVWERRTGWKFGMEGVRWRIGSFVQRRPGESTSGTRENPRGLIRWPEPARRCR